ncbi:MAG: hypothetical protein H7210_11075, partial [Pyrinomonadaceae bacterium]|nr:hypothetical protein [Phycisphaerales bacterium]
MLKWIVIVLQALLSAAALAAEPPTNKQLIAAMTPTTESVIIWRIEPLMSDKSVLKAHAGKLSWTWLTPGKDDQLVGCISEALTKATIRVQVLAGSKFQPVKGIGAGEHELRQIMYTKDSLEEVRKKLDNKDGVKDLGKNLALNGITVYTSDIVLPWDKLAASKMADEKDPKAKPKTTPVFAAFPDDHCVVITFSQTEMDLLLKGLKAP